MEAKVHVSREERWWYSCGAQGRFFPDHLRGLLYAVQEGVQWKEWASYPVIMWLMRMQEGMEVMCQERWGANHRSTQVLCVCQGKEDKESRFMHED